MNLFEMVLHIICYLSFVFFVVMTLWTVVKFATMPLHLRWELYPVEHERGHPSGGSYLEDLHWRDKPRKKSMFGELKFIADEILFFRTHYRHKRGYWFSVYPFHIGIFSLIVWFVLLIVGGMMKIAGIPVVKSAGNLWGSCVFYLTIITGFVGFFAATWGCIGLLIRRFKDEELRIYTSPKEYFTLCFMLITFLSGIASWAFFDISFETIRGFMVSLLTFAPIQSMNPATYINILLICLFLFFAPFTKMMHFLGKYFSFHNVRWDDDPNVSASRIRRKIANQLNYVMTWSASHVPSGKKWGEVLLKMDKTSEHKENQ